MTQKIVVRISKKTGKMTFDAQGFNGVGCDAALKLFMQKLNMKQEAVEEVKKKTEYFETEPLPAAIHVAE